MSVKKELIDIIIEKLQKDLKDSREVLLSLEREGLEQWNEEAFSLSQKIKSWLREL